MEFIEFLSKDALKELQTANAELVKMVANVDTVGQKMKGLSTPSGADGAIKDLTNQYKEQEKTIKSLQAQLEKLAKSKQVNNQKTTEEIVNQQVLRKNAIDSARANSTLAGAYANLSAQVSIASKRYQDLIVRGKTAEQTQRQYNKELRTAQKEFQTLQSRVLQADSAVGKWNRTGERSIGFVKNLVGAFGIVGGVTLFATLTKDIFDTTKELQSLDNALKQVTGTQENFAEQQSFLTRISEAYGLEIKGLTKQFTQFYVSAKDKLAGREIQNIFESVSKSGAVMGLTVENQERAFLALNQMMSKGVVSAEELRGQLGEALPGAFGIMAKALNVNEQQLGKMMKDGKLLASDVLPKFAKQLEITYGIETINRVDTLASSQNRLSNSWTNFVREVNEGSGVLNKSFIGLFNVLNDLIKGTTLLFQTAETGRKNTLKSLEDKGYQDYIKNVGNLTKEELENVKKYNEEKINENARLVNTLIEQNNKLRADVRKTPLGDILSRENQNSIKKNNTQINSVNNLSSLLKGQIKAITELTAVEKINTNNKVKTVEELEKERKAREKLILKLREEYLERTKFENSKPKEGRLSELEKRKQEIENLQKTVSNSNEDFVRFQKVIDALQISIDLIKDPSKVITADTSAFEKQVKGMNDYKKALEDAKKAMEDFANAYALSFTESFFNDNGLSTVFDIVNGKLEDFGDNWIAKTQMITEGVQEMYNFITNASQQNFDAEYERLEQQKNIALLFAGDSASGRVEIERQAEEKRKEIARREAKAKQKQAIFNIAIDTAQAILGLWVKPGFPAAIPLAVGVGALGLAQIAAVNSQQIPEFYKGTDNAPMGWAKTDERGAEIHTDSKGNIKDFGSDKGARLKFLEKGDKIFTAEKSRELMFNSDLNNLLMRNNINSPIVVNNSGLNNSDFKQGISHLAETINNKSEFELVRDRRGERIYKRENGQKIELIGNQLRFKGQNV